MSTKCKHGLDPRFCAECRRTDETKPLPTNPVRITQDGKPAIMLRLQPESQRATVVLWDGTIASVECSALHTVEVAAGFDQEGVLRRFHDIALERGYLFYPNRPLTVREQVEKGPSRCYWCKSLLSFQKGSLGCRQCGYYVCQCGRCLCGYDGWNYLRQYFAQYPPLPILWEQRLEFVRVVRFCSNRGWQKP